MEIEQIKGLLKLIRGNSESAFDPKRFYKLRNSIRLNRFDGFHVHLEQEYEAYVAEEVLQFLWFGTSLFHSM